MLDYLFGAASFLPHGFCLLWRPDLVALHAASDFAIGGAYLSIPLAILAFLRRRPAFEYRGTAALFAAFIVLCGLTHFANIAMLYYPYYGLDGMLKAVTGIVSVATAILLWPLLPKVVALPSPKELQEANSRLAAEVQERLAAEAALRRAHDDLERRVADRTADLAESLREKETLLMEVHHRVKNNLQSLLALLMMEQRQVEDPTVQGRFDALRGRVEVMARIHENLYSSPSLAAVDMSRQVEELCGDLQRLLPDPDRITVRSRVDHGLCSTLDVAMPLGLLVNELVHNAVKHAFPDGRAGTIHVSLAQNGDGTVDLLVIDDGVGDPAAAATAPSPGTGRTGIGKRLVKVLAGQLNGTVTTAVGPGTTVRVQLPAGLFLTPGPDRTSHSATLAIA